MVQLLFVGRVVLGVGVGAGTMIGPVYLAEMAPAKLRGSLNVIFQLFVSLAHLGRAQFLLELPSRQKPVDLVPNVADIMQSHI